MRAQKRGDVSSATLDVPLVQRVLSMRMRERNMSANSAAQAAMRELVVDGSAGETYSSAVAKVALDVCNSADTLQLMDVRE